MEIQGDKLFKNYLPCIVKFITWLYENHRHLLSQELLQEFHQQGFSQSLLKTVLSEKQIKPVKFDELTGLVFVNWIKSMTDRDGNLPKGGPRLRSSFNYLYSMYGQVQSPRDQIIIKSFWSETFNKKQAPVDHLQFCYYKELGKILLSKGEPDYIFCHTVLVLTWNLLCEPIRTFDLKLQDFSWDHECMGVLQKNTNQPEAILKHCFPNHAFPEICPLLSLGIYWTTHPFSQENLLFPGTDQLERFKTIWEETADYDTEIHAAVEKHRTFVTESIQIGAINYCRRIAGLRHRPQGWLQSKETEDMHVGRISSGLPHDQREFDAFGPLFKNQPHIVDFVRRIFPNVPQSLIPVAAQALASLVYHEAFLKSHLPPHHPLFQSVLFRDETILNELKPQVYCYLNEPVSLRPTQGQQPFPGFAHPSREVMEYLVRQRME